MGDIKAELDGHYGSWSLAENEDATVPLKLRCVTPEKFAIQLAAHDEETEGMTLVQALTQPLGQRERRNAADQGTKEVGIKSLTHLASVGTKSSSR